MVGQVFLFFNINLCSFLNKMFLFSSINRVHFYATTCFWRKSVNASRSYSRVRGACNTNSTDRVRAFAPNTRSFACDIVSTSLQILPCRSQNGSNTYRFTPHAFIYHLKVLFFWYFSVFNCFAFCARSLTTSPRLLLSWKAPLQSPLQQSSVHPVNLNWLLL